MSSWGDITDAEFDELRARFGDIVYEEPAVALALVEDLRHEERARLYDEIMQALAREARQRLH